MIFVLNSGSQSIKWALFSKEEKRGEISGFKDLKIPKEVKKIGHRVVHGGNEFKKPVLITKSVIKKLERLNYLAPLHNPSNLKGDPKAKTNFTFSGSS